MPRYTAKGEGALWLAGGIILLWAAGVIGWVMNIVAIANGTFDPLTPMMVLRLVGIFMLPLGGVLGWF